MNSLAEKEAGISLTSTLEKLSHFLLSSLLPSSASSLYFYSTNEVKPAEALCPWAVASGLARYPYLRRPAYLFMDLISLSKKSTGTAATQSFWTLLRRLTTFSWSLKSWWSWIYSDSSVSSMALNLFPSFFLCSPEVCCSEIWAKLSNQELSSSLPREYWLITGDSATKSSSSETSSKL